MEIISILDLRLSPGLHSQGAITHMDVISILILIVGVLGFIDVTIKSLHVVTNLTHDIVTPLLLEHIDLLEDLILLILILVVPYLLEYFFNISEGLGHDVDKEVVKNVSIITL